MGTIRELLNPSTGQISYQALVRRAGHSLTRTFGPDRKAAAKWVADVEAAIRINSPLTPFNREDWLPQSPTKMRQAVARMGDVLPDPNEGWTMAKALAHYRDTVSVWKACYEQEKTRIKFLTESLGHIKLAKLTAQHVQQHIDAREKAGKSGATIRLEVQQIRAMWKHARKAKPHGWGLDLGMVHPCSGLTLPELAPARDRRLHDADQEVGIVAEEQALRTALAQGLDGEEMVDIYDLALLTGMRRSEIVSLKRDEIRTARGIWTATKTKHKTKKKGHIRRLVLCSEAVAILRRRMVGLDPTDRLFSLSATQVFTRFAAARTRAKVTGLRWHDLRHEAISRMADMGLTLGELQAQSGHRSAQMLLRYTNAKARDIAAKLG
jgi:integrase